MSLAPVISPYGHAEEGPASEFPPVPESVQETGLSEEFVVDLLLKTLYVQGARMGKQLVDVIRLPFEFIDERLLSLQQRRMVEVRGTTGPSRGGYVFDLTQAGRERAREALASSQYVGAAPVPLGQYRTWVEKQTIRNVHVTRETVQNGFQGMVLSEAVHDVLGPAINSAKSLFLYGAPGNGKTMIAETISGLLGGDIFVPFAVEIEGQIMVIYDPVYHHAVDADEIPSENGEEPTWLSRPPAHDRRYIKVRRPVVLTGGELTLEQLDLQYDRFSKMYRAPFQLKANGGVLILDDFGRQRVPPRDLLNRWIVPLEKRIDFLTLHTGGKFPVPFDTLLIMATNLEPEHLVEEAFLRRIHYKVSVNGPNPEEYAEIFQRCCRERSLPYNPDAVAFIYREFYGKRGIHPRGCHPRDILDHLTDIIRFVEGQPSLSPQLLDRACRSYFLEETVQE